MSLLPATETLALPRLQVSPRRLVAGVAGVAAVVAIVVLAGSPLQTFSHALSRAASADPLLLALAVAAEVASFAGYAALTWLVLSRITPRITPAVSAQLTLAGTAVNRLLPTAGLGGIGLALWTLRRAGLPGRRATAALLTFLVVLYAVFLTGVILAGVETLTGGAGDAPLWVGAAPVAFGVAAIATGLWIAALGPDRFTGDGRLRSGAHTLAVSVRGAIAVVRSRDLRLAGALAWWGFDLAVLAAALAALGDAPPLGVIALAYFAGTIANTIPIPGAVASGLTGILLLCGVPADLALPAVLTYRAVSLWIPIPIGALAFVGLRRTTATWEDDPTPSGPCRPEPCDQRRAPLTGGRRDSRRPCDQRRIPAPDGGLSERPR